MSTPTQANQAPIGDPGKLRHVEAGSVQEFLTTPEAKRWADALEVLSDPHVPTHIAELMSREA